MEFGDQLKLLREAQNLTQAELADRVNLSRAAISLYEAGTREPLRSRARRLATALGKPPGFFDQDDLWAEVEEALAQAHRILLGADNHAEDATDNHPTGAAYDGTPLPTATDEHMLDVRNAEVESLFAAAGSSRRIRS